MTNYPKPPYRNRRQAMMPSSTAKMDPRQDHAETSYKGLGERAVITGGENGSGRPVAIAFAREANVDESEDPNEVAALTQKEGNKAFRSADDCRAVDDRAVREFGGGAVLVSNCGRKCKAA